MKDTYFYKEFDLNCMMWCVFGDNTGKAYYSCMAEEEATKQAALLNAAHCEDNIPSAYGEDEAENRSAQ